MNTFRRLALPIDGSKAALRGVAFAAQLAKREGAFVDVCSAIDEAAVMLPLAEGALIDPEPLIDALIAGAEKHVAAAVHILHEAGVGATGTVLRGYPVGEIDTFVRAKEADAIVMGTNGRAGIDRLFLGSVTMAIIRLADVPVVTVHADDTLDGGPLLVAVDASAASLAALDCAIERARVAGVALALLHVFGWNSIEQLSSTVGIRPQSAGRRALSDAENALDEAADHVRAAGLTFRTELYRGEDPAAAILTAAERHGAGAIVMGTHGRGGLERLLIGSVADRVVRAAQLPVYVIRRHGVAGQPLRTRARRAAPVIRETVSH
jgi:nucleotide-binding universal stress UspA family protein